jgi:hypothetical protein
MFKQEKNNVDHLSLDDYTPQPGKKLIIWKGGEVQLPLDAGKIPTELMDCSIFIWQGKQTIAFITLTHQDYPGVQVQWQVVLKGKEVGNFIFQQGDEEDTELMPDELVDHIFAHHVQPAFKKKFPELFPAKTVDNNKKHIELSDDFENYRPANDLEAILWQGKDFPIPTPKDLKKDQFGWLGYVNNSRSAIVLNAIHREFPGVYCQMQIVFDKETKQDRLFVVCPIGQKNRMPVELLERLYHGQVRPFFHHKYPEIFKD